MIFFLRGKSDNINSLPETLQWFCIVHRIGCRLWNGPLALQLRIPPASPASVVLFPHCSSSPWTFLPRLCMLSSSLHPSLRSKSHPLRRNFLVSLVGLKTTINNQYSWHNISFFKRTDTVEIAHWFYIMTISPTRSWRQMIRKKLFINSLAYIFQPVWGGQIF